jgi:hypothetical protein
VGSLAKGGVVLMGRRKIREITLDADELYVLLLNTRDHIDALKRGGLRHAQAVAHEEQIAEKLLALWMGCRRGYAFRVIAVEV